MRPNTTYFEANCDRCVAVQYSNGSGIFSLASPADHADSWAMAVMTTYRTAHAK